MAEGATKVCQKCGKSMDVEKQFYKKRDGSRVDLCKKCLTMHVDNFNPDTFTWILKDMDYPYVPEEWNTIRNKEFAKHPNLNGTSVLGKYLSKMKLRQWEGKGWADSQEIIEQSEEKERIRTAEQEEYEDELKRQFENGEITEAQYKTLVSTETQNDEYLTMPPDTPPAAFNPFDNPSEYIDESMLVDLGADLTDDDKVYLAMKWGRYYKPSEWVELEKTYKEMEESFDIQDADTINTLIVICKTYLKMNQAIDSGDVEGFQKFSKAYNDLRKSAKFTAAQNKDEKDEYVDSIGELITLCERQGFIPRFATDIAQDKVDATLKDMNEYVKKLVTQDLGFGQQIEDALKKIEIQREMNETANQEDFSLEDNDFEEYYKQLEEQRQQDSEEETGEE